MFVSEDNPRGQCRQESDEGRQWGERNEIEGEAK